MPKTTSLPQDPRPNRTEPIRRRRESGVGGAVRTTQPGSYEPAWSGPKPYVRGPLYASQKDAPPDLVARATEKRQWVQRFVQEGCPRGKLVEYARQSALANGIPEDRVPPYTTLVTWAHQFREHGLLGLLDGVRSDAGVSRTVTPDQENLFKIFLLGQGGGVAAALRFAGTHSTGPLPSYDAAWRAVQRMAEIDPHAFAFAKHGESYFRHMYEASIAQGFVPGGYRLAIDSTVADQWVRVPCGKVACGWRPVRPVLTVVEDVGTRLLVTFALGLYAIDSDIITGIFGAAINQEMNYPGLFSTGVPYEVNVDRGAEHQAGFRTLLKTLGIDLVPRKENRPKGGARVERLIQTVQLEVFAHLTGYSKKTKPFDPYAKPDKDQERRLRDLVYEPWKQEFDVMMLPTLPQLEAKILTWASIHYNLRPHSGLPRHTDEIRRAMAAFEAAHRTALQAQNGTRDVA